MLQSPNGQPPSESWVPALRPQEIDWAGIRAAAIALQSVRLAATKASAHLPPNEQRRFVERVNKRAYRERWLDKAKALSKPRDNGSLPLSKPVQTGADALAEILADDNRQTRISLSGAARKAAEHLAASNPAKIVREHHALRSITKSAAELHNWNQTHPEKPFSLNVLNLGDLELEIRHPDAEP